MRRREFLTVAGAVAAAYPMRNAEFGMRNRSSNGQFRTPHSAFRIRPAQEPSLGPEVFQRRLERARAELQARRFDLLIATPGTNYEYLTGYNPGRSERPIAITQDAMAATFAQLAVGTSEVQVAQALSREMEQRGAPGGGLVQFGPSSALPHGGPAGPVLAREAVVLIDCGCRVGGYTSDITRTIWFGDHPSDEFRNVFNLVHDAQTAAMELGRPGTPCEEMDRAARKVITAAGSGPFFTHRLGHGLGMDGHEPEYLVEGNKTRLEPGMVFTIEPGIYQLGKFGVRIEDDCVMTESGVEVLSKRASKL